MSDNSRPAEESGRHASFWKIWIPIPILFLLLDLTFNLYFWQIPKLTGRFADYGYQFLIDARKAREPKPSGTLRVIAFGSSVTGSFDPHQVRGLLSTAAPEVPVEVHRLLKPGMKPADYRLFFEAQPDLLQADVVVWMFNLVDFLNPGFERGLRRDVQYVLPPWPTLVRRHARLSTTEEFDLLAREASNLYAYHRPIRSCLRDHLRLVVHALTGRRSHAPYGIYPDGYTKRRFGLLVDDATSIDFEYFVHPAWIRQRGEVRLQISMNGGVIARRTETAPGWKTLHADLHAGRDRVLHVGTDSVWNPRAGRVDDDVRLLGVRLRKVPDKAGSKGPAPLRYPPVDDREVSRFLRLGGRTGKAYMEKWRQITRGDSAFAVRMRAYRRIREELRDRRFDPTAEFAEMTHLIRDFTSHGTRVILINTPESALLGDYYRGPYYRGYLAFFSQLAEHNPMVRFANLHDRVPIEDFNDPIHVNYVGEISMGPVYADLLRQVIEKIAPQTKGGDGGAL